jgi:hypothetical protein
MQSIVVYGRYNGSLSLLIQPTPLSLKKVTEQNPSSTSTQEQSRTIIKWKFLLHHTTMMSSHLPPQPSGHGKIGAWNVDVPRDREISTEFCLGAENGAMGTVVDDEPVERDNDAVDEGSGLDCEWVGFGGV